MNSDIKKRDLDGCYFRVQRSGRWVDRCWTDLTEEEWEVFGKDRELEWWKSLADHLAYCLRKIGDDLDVTGDGE